MSVYDCNTSRDAKILIPDDMVALISALENFSLYWISSGHVIRPV